MNSSFNKAISLKHFAAWNKYQVLLECYNKAIELNPNYSDAYCNKGSALYYLERYQEAIECYNKAIELNPNYSNAYNNKGLALKNLERYQEAFECYIKAIENKYKQ